MERWWHSCLKGVVTMLLLGHEAWWAELSAQAAPCMPDQLWGCVQVALYADYEPGRLMSFLAASCWVMKLCGQRFLLGNTVHA